MRSVNYLILGAGPTGLGAAYRLNELGVSNYLVVEKNNYAGGLATTYTDEKGFLWDFGGHVQFSHYDYFDEVMTKALGDNWLKHNRESFIYNYDRFIPYPFQNNLNQLPKEVIWKCIQGLLDNKKEIPSNFKEWIFSVFGAGIASEFMLPYNFKVWAHPLNELDYNWIGERVPVIELEDVLQKVILNEGNDSWGPNRYFQFPKFGGTGEIWKQVAQLSNESKIDYNAKVDRIDQEKKIVYLNDGSQIKYQHLLTTLALPITANMIGDSQLVDASVQLKYSSTNVVGIGLEGKPPEHLKSKNWIYFPKNNSPYYRVTVFSNYSPNNSPNVNTWSLMTETSESEHKPVNSETLIEQTIQALIEDKFIATNSKVISKVHYKEQFGYPTPFLGRDEIVNELLKSLLEKDIYSRGRFGGWKYEVSNQDHSFMQGVEWANFIIRGEEEVTFFNPDKANSGFFKTT